MSQCFIFLVILLFPLRILAAHNSDCIYQLPYKTNTEHRVIQSYDGKYSHQAPLQYALDFEMGIGTKIYAARAGTVIGRNSTFPSQGSKNKSELSNANFIQIMHKDNTIGFYAHLKQGGALVDVGEQVKQGELIGLSGCSGFCDGAHLHFEVFKWNKDHRESIPLKIYANNKVIEKFKRQSTYQASLAPRSKKCLEEQVHLFFD